MQNVTADFSNVNINVSFNCYLKRNMQSYKCETFSVVGRCMLNSHTFAAIKFGIFEVQVILLPFNSAVLSSAEFASGRTNHTST